MKRIIKGVKKLIFFYKSVSDDYIPIYVDTKLTTFKRREMI